MRKLPDYRSKRKLLQGLDRIAALSDDEIRDEEVLLGIVRGIGLRYDNRGLYGDEVVHMNWTHNGLWQTPKQLVGAMLLLAEHRIESFLEVGTHSGYTFAVLAAYLHRLNPELRALTIDPFDYFRHYEAIRAVLPIEYRHCTSEDLRGQAFDCVLIDGDHTYEAVCRDYENVGRFARICLFHDINDDHVGQQHVPRCWRELVQRGEFSESHELLDCPPGMRVMGIGVGLRSAA